MLILANLGGSHLRIDPPHIGFCLVKDLNHIASCVAVRCPLNMTLWPLKSMKIETRFIHIHLRKLIWQWKNNHLKMYLLLKTAIFHCHVSFLEGKSSRILNSKVFLLGIPMWFLDISPNKATPWIKGESFLSCQVCVKAWSLVTPYNNLILI